LWLGLLCLGVACNASKKAPIPEPERPIFEPSTFTRFVPGAENGEGELQVAVVRYVNPADIEVSLISAVHIGDPVYYDGLEKMFEEYDVVLYELVAPSTYVPRPGQKPRSVITVFQRMLENLLELEFQLDAIDYSRDNFVHADLDPVAFRRLQRERGETLVTLMFRLMLEEWKAAGRGEASNLGPIQILAALASDDSARTLKYLLAQELENVEKLLAGLGGDDEDGSVILTERNKKAIAVLEEELARGQKRLCIFYGAAHMPDLEKRLVVGLGFDKRDQRWVTAWDVRSK
jgi:hypothetical protein